MDLTQHHRHLLQGSPPSCHYNHLQRTLSVSFVTLVILTLICYLLNSVFRCIRRSNGPADLTTTGSTVISEPGPSCCNELPSIPVLVYGDPLSLPSASCSSSLGSENCAICLADITYGETVRVLPRCKHMFHKDCIDQWLLRSSSCPVCRDCIIEQDVEPAANHRNNGDGNLSKTGNGWEKLNEHKEESAYEKDSQKREGEMLQTT
ncbi:hypothetical protein HHK36_008675 [Tetracentron sinense]|uniref:RING-type domain-containing protein n=1 Tax=Tetracentron sinense TaxID=13715 RepID=A0A834ZH57_TETSI|nr:hypothetical protein HHK36_008675 [Tetracentron sinense]